MLCIQIKKRQKFPRAALFVPWRAVVPDSRTPIPTGPAHFPPMYHLVDTPVYLCNRAIIAINHHFFSAGWIFVNTQDLRHVVHYSDIVQCTLRFVPKA